MSEQTDQHWYDVRYTVLLDELTVSELMIVRRFVYADVQHMLYLATLAWSDGSASTYRVHAARLSERLTAIDTWIARKA
jgi:hypothetical protein